MCKVCYKETLVEEAVALQAHALSSSAAQIVCVVGINADVRFVVYDTRKAHRSSLILADVLGKTLRKAGIRLLQHEAS